VSRKESAFEEWPPRIEEFPKQPSVSLPSRAQADAGQTTGQPSFVLGGQYPITDYYVPEVGFQAELDLASIWGEGFSLTGCPSIFLGKMSLSNRKGRTPSRNGPLRKGVFVTA